MLSGNGNLLLFRTQAVNAGGASSPQRGSAVVAAVSGDGKSTTGEVPSPTTDTPPPADVPPPPPTGSTEDPATSGDGNTTGNTVEPDPGTGEGEPEMEVDETPPDERRHAVHRRRCRPTSGPTAGGAIVDIQGANFVGGQTTVLWNGSVDSPSPSSTARSLRVTAPPSPTASTVRSASASSSTGEASNEVQYTYAAA